MTDEQTLRDELDEVERRVKELRGARHAITYDLEQSLKERDRLQRHLNPEDERGD